MSKNPVASTRFLKQLSRALRSTPTDRLSQHAKCWIKEWNQSNSSRRQTAYPVSTHYLYWATGHPVRAVVLPLLVGVALVTVYEVSDHFGLNLFPGLGSSNADQKEHLGQLENLWTIQATITALVYPIVLAFVALLLRAKASAKTLLEVYLVETGAVVAGTSSMALVLAIGIGHTVIVLFDRSLIGAVLLLALPWFIVNGYLTTRFLYQTLLFLNDDHRLMAIERYAVHIALPREIYAYLLRHILWRAQEQILLPGKSSVSSYEIEAASDRKPSIDLNSPIDDGTPAVVLRTSRRRQVADVRLRNLRWGLNLWLWMCWRQVACSNLKQRVVARMPFSSKDIRPGVLVQDEEPPILSMRLHPNEMVFGERTAFGVSNGPRPGWLSRLLLRRAFVLRTPKAPEQSYKPHHLLSEFVQDLIEVTPNGTYDAIRDRLLYVTHVHAALLDAGAYINDDGHKENAACVANTEGFFSQRPSAAWAHAYDDWLQESVRQMEQNAYGFQQACYLASKMIRDQDIDPLRIPADLLDIHRSLINYLSKHWLRRSDIIEPAPNPIRAAELSAASREQYDRAMRASTEGWEACIWNTRRESRDFEPAAAWQRASLEGRFQRKYLERTVEMIFSAAAHGDLIAAKQLTRSFLGWPNKCGYQLGHYSPVYNRVPRFLTVVALDRPWGETGLALAMAQNPTADVSVILAAICGELLLRFWSDLRQVLFLLMLKWTSSGSESEPAMAIAIQLLEGPDEHYGIPIDKRDFADHEAIVVRLIRQHFATYSYQRRLDVLCEDALRRWSPDRSHERNESAGWRDVASLRRPLLAFLFAAAPQVEFNADRMDRIILAQETTFDATRDTGYTLGEFLKRALANARQDRGEAWKRDVAVVKLLRARLQLPDADQATTEWVQSFLDWLEDLPASLTWTELAVIPDADGLDDGRF